MGTQVDDLTIKLQGDVKNAEGEIDKLISKVGLLGDKISNFGSKSNGSIAKSFASIDFSGAKNKFDKFQSYVDKAAGDMSKKLIIDFEIRDETAKNRIAELTQMLLKERAEASKLSEETGQRASFNGEEIGKQLEYVIVQSHNVRDSAKAATSEWKSFYDILSAYSGKINIGKDGLAEIKATIGEWKHLDGLIKQVFTSEQGKGISADTVFGDFDTALGGKLQRLADNMDNTYDNKEKKIMAMIEALRLYRQELEALPKASKDDVSYGLWDSIIEKCSEVDKVTRNTFENIDSRVAKLREVVGDAGKNFATEGGGKFLDTTEKINAKIEQLQAHISDISDKAALKSDNSTVWENYQKEIIKTENQIASLQAKLDSFNDGNATASIERFNRATDKAIERMHEAEAAQKAANYEAQQSVAKEDTFGDYKAYDNALKRFEEIQKEAKGAVEGTKEFQDSLRKTRIRLDDLRENPLEKYNLVKPREEFVDLSNKIDKAVEKLYGFRDALIRGFATNKKFAQTREFQQIQYDAKQTRTDIQDLSADLERLGNKTHEVNWSFIGEQAKSAFGSTLNLVRRLTGAVSSLARTIGGKVVNGFKNFIKSLNKTDDVSKRLVKSFTRVGNMLRLMITRMALRGVINETRQSFAELTQFSDKTAASFNKIKNAIKYLADTLVTLAAPILNASGTFRGLGNIIDAVTDKIVDLINKFNQLLSALLGHSTWIKATKQTKDYTKSVDKAGKAAKRALQPFDELNNLTSNDSGSGGADSGTGGSQFEELPIDPKWARIADWLKDMWAKADFTDLGRLLGEKLRDALNSIPWGKIQNAARKLGKSLATLLNGFFTTPGLAKSIGNSIAQAINTGLIFAEEFIKNFNFGAFGKFIGDSIVTAIKNIHWQRFIDACKNLGKGIATAINSLVNTGVISEIGKAIGKILLAAINFAFELVTNIDFDKLAEEIANGIKNFLGVLGAVDKETGLNGWEKIGKTISDALLGILKILNTTLGDKTILKQISDGITSMLNQIDFAEIIGQSGKLIFNIARAFATVIIAAFKSEEFRKGIVAAIPYLAGAFALSLAGKGLASVATTIAKNLARNLGIALLSGELTSTVGSAISTALAGVGGTIAVACATLAAGVVSFFAGADIGNTIGKYLYPDDKELYEKYDGIKGTINLTLEAIVTFYQRAYERISEWLQKYVEYQKTCITTASSFIKEKFNDIKSFVTGKISEIKANVIGTISTIVSTVQTTIGSVVSFVRTSGQSIYTAITGVFTSLGQFFSTLPQKASTWGSNFIAGLISGMQQKLSGIGGIVSTVVSYINQKAGGGVFVNGHWKPIQGYAGGGMPKSAEMFLARENGAPELVGTMGGHTAVANNDQIVASVSDGVYRAVMAAMANQNSNTNVNVELVGDTAKLFKAIRKEGSDYQRRTGNPVWA